MSVPDNPFMAGAFHGVTEPETVINVGVSGPGVVKHALEAVRGQDIGAVAETIKKTAFKNYSCRPVGCTGSRPSSGYAVWYY